MVVEVLVLVVAVVLVRISSSSYFSLRSFSPKSAQNHTLSNCALDLFIVTLVFSILCIGFTLELTLWTCLKNGNSYHLQAVVEVMELKVILIQHLSKDPERITRVLEVNEGMRRRC